MNNQEKNLLDLISRLNNIDKNLCKKKLQKIIYLIEQNNFDLGFDYKIHIYGPYSEDLDFMICQLMSEKKLNISYTNKGHIITASDNIEQDVDNKVLYVIKNFGDKTPLELELLTTALYVQRNIENAIDDRIINNVKKIKGKKFNDEKIGLAIQKLKDANYFC